MGFPLLWLQSFQEWRYGLKPLPCFVMHSSDDTSRGLDWHQVIPFLVSHTHTLASTHIQQGCKSWMWTCKYPLALFWVDLRSPTIKPAAASQVTSHDIFDSFLSMHVKCGEWESTHTSMCWPNFSFHIVTHLIKQMCFATRLQGMRKCRKWRSVLSRKLVSQELCVPLGMPCFPKRLCQGCMCCTQGQRLAKTIPGKTAGPHSFFNQVVENFIWSDDVKEKQLSFSLC